MTIDDEYSGFHVALISLGNTYFFKDIYDIRTDAN